METFASLREKEVHNVLSVKDTNLQRKSRVESLLNSIIDRYDIEPSIETVSINSVISFQPTVTDELVDCLGNNKRPVDICRIDDRLIMLDGNHRANAFLRDDKDSISARVYDLSHINCDKMDELRKELNRG